MKRATALVVLFLVLAGAPAASYVLMKDITGEAPRWPGATAVVHHDPDTFGPKRVAALESALATWSGVEGSDFRFVHGGPSEADDVRVLGNGSSDCYFDKKLDRYAYAVTLMNWLGRPYVLERDIAFNANPDFATRIVWTTEPTNRAGGPADIETVALHELGHVVGLGHSKSTSVMNTDRFPDPAIAHRDLFPDDEDGVRALYPPGTSAGPDLVIDGIEVDGDEIRVTVTNRGDVPSGPFLVSAHLTNRVVPSPIDPLSGTADVVQVLAQETAVVTIDHSVHAGIPPGEYRVGVILDSPGVTGDTDRSNNATVAPDTVRVTRPAILIGVGARVLGYLGPFGADSVVFDALAGTTVRFRHRMIHGTAATALSVRGVEQLRSRVAGSAKLKFAVERDDRYRLDLLSGWSGSGSYELRTKAKTIRGRYAEELSAGWTLTVPIPAYAGSEVRIVVRGKNGLRPAAAVGGVDVPGRTNGKGTKVTLGPFAAPATGRLRLEVSGLDGSHGTAKVTWRCRTRKPATPTQR